MFETAELGHKIPKPEFEERIAPLRMELLRVQREAAYA